MKDITVQTGPEGKGRSFRASLLGYVQADSLTPTGSYDAVRPVVAVIAGSHEQMRAVVANMGKGKQAEIGRHRYLEMMKSWGYQYRWQRTRVGSVCTMFLPGPLVLDPGVLDPERASFLLLPSQDQLENMPEYAKAACDHMTRCGGFQHLTALIKEVVRYAPLFAAYMDKRTRCPLIPDPIFYCQLLGAALLQGAACFPGKTWEKAIGRSTRVQVEGLTDVGFAEPLLFRATHSDLEELLADTVTRYYKAVAKNQATAVSEAAQ